MQQNLEVQCERCTNTFVTKCTCLQVSKGSTKTTRAAQGKRHMSPNGSVKVSTNLFYAQAECWDLSRGSIWCNWKVCENQAKKLYLSRNYCKVYVDHCGPCVCFDWKVRFPVTHLPWLECNHWLDHMVNSNAYNQNGRNSQVLQCLNWNWFWLIGEYLGSEQVAAVVQYTDHAGSGKNLHIHADFILVVFF